MFERCLYFNTQALARRVNKIWSEAFRKYGLSPAHGYLLRLICQQPGMVQKQIAAELKLEKSTVTRCIDVLESEGLLKRNKAAQTDQREQGIYPTRKGEKLGRELDAAGEALYKKMLKSVGEEELKTLVGLLREAEGKLG
jgi:DNA-binding MarR family transcriptional regulator